MSRKKYRLTDGYTTKNLLHYGCDHLACAKYVIDKHPRMYDSAGYLIHLGIELIIKAILLQIRGYFEETHRLIQMYEEIKNLRKKWILPKKHLKTLEKVDQFYNLRYPPTKDQIEIGSDDWQQIEELFNTIVRRFPKRLQNELQTIGHSSKGNRILMRKRIR